MPNFKTNRPVVAEKNGNTHTNKQTNKQTTTNFENYKYRLVVCPVKNGWLYGKFYCDYMLNKSGARSKPDF